MFLTRGFTFTHEAVRNWEARFAPLLTERLRAKRRGRGGVSWSADETDVKVHGRWCYLYRAIGLCRKVDSHILLSTISSIFYAYAFPYMVWFVNFATEPEDGAVRRFKPHLYGRG